MDSSVKEIVEKLVASDMRFHFSCFTSASFMVHTSHLRLAAVHLVDSHYCSDPAKFISVCLTSLTTMLQVYSVDALCAFDDLCSLSRLLYHMSTF